MVPCHSKENVRFAISSLYFVRFLHYSLKYRVGNCMLKVNPGSGHNRSPSAETLHRGLRSARRLMFAQQIVEVQSVNTCLVVAAIHSTTLSKQCTLNSATFKL